MPLYRVTDIEWDVEDEDVDDVEEACLPDSAYVNAPDGKNESEIADILSDELGYAIKSLSCEVAVVFVS